ncbi:MAG: hypothetical protein DWQ36_01615 [Acidobacteria bacterium]|nr:MAG: hypothetical protein DWQ30_14405 [Acidobacteriota bacterium]REK11703.1 MAG: hypothetical protein DWQ36_01615 [Acidobacteriota bacterium]
MPVASALVWLLTSVASAQPGSLAPEQQERVRDSGLVDAVTVRLVEVWVRVYDARSQPVTGLSAEDFELREDGALVPVVGFEELAADARRSLEPAPVAGGEDVDRPRPAARPAGQVRSPAASSPRSTTALLVDFDALPLAGSSLQLRTLGEWITGRAGSPPGTGQEREGWILMAMRGGSLETRGLVHSAEEIDAWLEELGSRRPDARAIQMAAATRRAIGSIAASYEARCPQEQGVYCDAFCGHTLENALVSAQQAEREERRLVEDRASALEKALFALGGLEGPKTLLLLTDGMVARPGLAAYTYLEQLCPGEADQIRRLMIASDAIPMLQQLATRANAEEVRLVMIDGGGLRTPSTGSVEWNRADTAPAALLDQVERANDQAPLTLLAAETGGEAILEANDLATPLEKAMRRLDSGYLLSFEPPHAPSGERHFLDVKIKGARRGWRVAHRRTYVDKTLEQSLADSIRWRESSLARQLVERGPGGDGSGLGASLSSRCELRQERMHIELEVLLGGEALARRLAFDDRRAERLRLWAHGSTAEGWETTARQRFLDLPADGGATGSAAEHREPSSMAALRTTIELELPITEWSLGVGLRDEVSGETQYLSTALVAPRDEAREESRPGAGRVVCVVPTVGGAVPP